MTSSTSAEFYKHSIFESGTTNVGLRLVYRQEWRLLGAQRGEVVRTLPMAPRQSVRVSTKLVRRNKVERTAESLKAVESTTEVTDTSRDSIDIVDETVATEGMSVEAGGGFSMGGLGVSASASVNEETSTKVGSTSTSLTEAVQKTANKVRMESKMVVSTEGEITFETTSATEIQNPNDEIAVTYVYSKLQRQYEVFTHLNEVNTVVFVAEEIPTTLDEIEDFVTDNDWTIAKVLLDDSFRDALSAINQDRKQEEMDTGFYQKYENAMDITGGVLNAFAGKLTTLQLDQADPTQEIQRSFQQIEKEKLERTRSGKLYDLKKDRLLKHIRRNILHYCRAVWSQEDPDQRTLRYKKRDLTVPTQWEFVSATGSIPLALLQADPGAGSLVAAADPDLGLALSSFGNNELHEDVTGPTAGAFDPGETVYLDLDGDNTVSLGDTRLANAVTKGFADGSGVAAGDPDLGLALVSFAPNELHEDVTGPTAGAFDPGETVYLDADGDNTVSQGDARLANAVTQGFTLLVDGEFQSDPLSERPVADVINPAGPIGYHGNYAVFYAQPDMRLRGANVFDVLDLVRQPYIDSGDPPGFLDPARDYIEATRAVPAPIPPGTRDEMIEFVPDLRADYVDALKKAEDADPPISREDAHDQFIAEDERFTDERYWDYLFRKEFTRQLVVDTNNLVIDIEVGTGSTLEAFKRLHRFVDVRKAVQERDKLELENERLQARLAAQQLEDPDIENMTVIKCGCGIKACLGHIHGHCHGHDLDDDNEDCRKYSPVSEEVKL